MLTFVAGIVHAQDAPSTAANTADQTAQSDTAKVAPQPQQAAASDDKDELKPPPGFKVKKRGDKMLYCTKGAEIGTRFVTETCYDEEKMRQYLLARDQNQDDLARSRAVCATASVCSFQ
jgi:hypothetical protein